MLSIQIRSVKQLLPCLFFIVFLIGYSLKPRFYSTPSFDDPFVFGMPPPVYNYRDGIIFQPPV